MKTSIQSYQFQVVTNGRYGATFVGYPNQKTYLGSTEGAREQACQKARSLREFGPCKVEVSLNGQHVETIRL